MVKHCGKDRASIFPLAALFVPEQKLQIRARRIPNLDLVLDLVLDLGLAGNILDDIFSFANVYSI